MAPEPQQDFVTPLLSEFNTKLRDIEERQRLLKDRVLLIGENLVDSKEETEKDISTIKVNLEQMKRDIEKIKETLLRVIDDLDTKARKTEIDLIRKQFKLFEPLKLARLEDVERIIQEKIKK